MVQTTPINLPGFIFMYPEKELAMETFTNILTIRQNSCWMCDVISSANPVMSVMSVNSVYCYIRLHYINNPAPPPTPSFLLNLSQIKEIKKKPRKYTHLESWSVVILESDNKRNFLSILETTARHNQTSKFMNTAIQRQAFSKTLALSYKDIV